MNLFTRSVRSTLTWLNPQRDEDWAHRLAWSTTTIVSFPFVLTACAVLVLASLAFPGFDPEVYGVKQLFGAVWVLVWVAVFFPVDRITARHCAGVEPAESKWVIVQLLVAALALFALAAAIAIR